VQLGRLADGATIIPLRQGEEETLGHLWRKSIGIPQGSATPLVSTVVRRGIRPPCRRERTIMALTSYANGCTKGITCTRCHGYLIGDQWDACGGFVKLTRGRKNPFHSADFSLHSEASISHLE
jgi:hypothetical protein